jgi:hypothetical protein
MLAREEVCYRAFCQDKSILNAWSRLDAADELPWHERRLKHEEENTFVDVRYLHADRILRLRRALDAPESSRGSVMSRGYAVQTEDAEAERHRSLLLQNKKRKKRKRDEFLSPPDLGKSKLAELSHKSRAQVNAVNNDANDIARETRTPAGDVSYFTTEDAGGPPPVAIHLSVSSKLNWILHEVCNSCATLSCDLNV